VLPPGVRATGLGCPAQKTPARIEVIQAGGDLLFNTAVVVPGDHKDTGNGHTCDDKGDHI
jgi:hypothetical protein